ncbi:MAG: metallophosphoesterase [Polyangiaceae bacterium]|nr:metallophosphoesterase [Polyangiaceae bacterium]
MSATRAPRPRADRWRRVAALGALALGLALASACDGPGAAASGAPAPSTRHAPAASVAGASSARSAASAVPSAPPSASEAPPVASSRPGVPRIYALGDLHGDLDAMRETLAQAGLVDAADHWSGGDAVLVQLGDILDREDHEREILDLFARLEDEARAAGGSVVLLNGNHEYQNVAGDFRYVTPGGFRAFADLDDGAPALRSHPPEQRGRCAAFRPGGKYARYLAQHPMVLELAGNVFVHGGLLPKHVTRGVARLNAEAAAFLRGESPATYGFLADWDSPVMMRHYSDHPTAGHCAVLGQALAGLGARRMVVGHTPQLGGIASYCDGRVWAVDACLGSVCGSRRELLVIEGDAVRTLAAPPRPR